MRSASPPHLRGALARRIVDAADRLVPAALKADADRLLRARLVVIFSAFMIVFSPVFVLMYVAAGAPRIALVIALCTATAPLGAVLLRVTGSLLPPTLHMSGLLLVMFGFITATMGGPADIGTLYWFALLPLCAQYMGGSRAGMLCLATAMLEVATFFVLPMFGFQFPAAETPQGQSIVEAPGIVILMVLLYLLSRMFDAAKDSALASMCAANDRLTAARDDAERASRTKSDFLANMSHELRTPLNGVIGMTTFVLATRLDDEQRDSLRVVKTSGEALLALIDDLLDFSKIEARELELFEAPFSIRSCAREAVEMLFARATEKRFAIDLDVADDVPELVRGDAARLRQVLLNLLSNAVKFTEHGGVALVVRTDGAARGRVRFSVVDTGIGISPEGVARLFQPFTQVDQSVTRRFGGTGLGLALSQRIVEAMGGVITVESRPGEGATFTFTIGLPETSERSPAPLRDEPATALLSAIRGARVLIVEDNAVNQLVARRLLGGFGCACEVASNGEEALVALEREPWDIVLMDCQMPVLDGFAATRELRRREEGGRRTPVVALTAGAMTGDRERCLDAGMDDFLPKPITRAALARTLAAWRPR